MTITEALRRLAQGRIEPGYLLVGENGFWRREWLSQLKSVLFGADSALNVMRFEGKLDWPMAARQLATVGFFNPRQIVILDETSWTKKEATLDDYLHHPVPGSVMVVLEKKASAALLRIFGAEATIDLKDLRGAELSRFIRGEAKAHGVELTNAGVDVLAARFGNAGDQIRHELDKMGLDPVAPRWDGENVARVTLPLPTLSERFAVSDALLEQNWVKTIVEIQRALEFGTAPVMLLVILGRTLAQILHAIEFRQSGQALAQFQETENLPAFVARKIWDYSRRWSRERVSLALERANRIDRALKNSQGEPAVWLGTWVAAMAERHA